MKKFIEKIKNGMKKLFELITNKWLLKGTTTVIVVAIVIACYFGLNWGIKQLKIENIDFTTNSLYSLSGETKNKLKDLQTDIVIQLINMNDYVFEYADRYPKVSDKITVDRVSDLESRIDLQTKYELSTEDAIIVVKNGEKEKVLQLEDLYTYEYVNSSYTTVDKIEEAITNSIIELTATDRPKIYVLDGKAYRDPEQSLGIVAYKLIDEANDIQTIDLLTTGSVPEDCDCLIITTLKQDLSETERNSILNYINNGGKLLIATSQSILNVDTPNFDQILAQYGVALNYGVVFEQDNSRTLYNTPNMMIAEASATFMDKLDMKLKLFMVNPGKIEFADETKLEELGVTYETIAATSESSFVRTNFEIASLVRTEEDSELGSSIVGAHVTKKLSDEKESQLIIYSDETFASTVNYTVQMYNNEDIVLNSVSHLTEREDTIVIRKTDEAEYYTVTDQEDVMIKTIIFVVPILIIGAGVVVMMVRKRSI